jgi:putative transposase
LLGAAARPSEAETFRKSFLRSLADRGLRGVKLVIADDHKGLRAAATTVFHATPRRCRVALAGLYTRHPFGHGSVAHRDRWKRKPWPIFQPNSSQP